MRYLRGALMASVLVATVSVSHAVGFSPRPGQTHDELKSEFVVATKTVLSPPVTNALLRFGSRNQEGWTGQIVYCII